MPMKWLRNQEGVNGELGVPAPHRGYRIGVRQDGVGRLDAVGDDGSGCGTDGSDPSASLGMTVRGLGMTVKGLGMTCVGALDDMCGCPG